MDDDGTIGAVDHADFENDAAGVGADEHHEAVVDVVDSDWMVQGVEYVVVMDAVFSERRRR